MVLVIALTANVLVLMSTKEVIVPKVRTFSFASLSSSFPAAKRMFKCNNRNSRTRCEICSKLVIKTPERRDWRHSGVFIVNFEHIFTLCSSIYIVNLEQVNVG